MTSEAIKKHLTRVHRQAFIMGTILGVLLGLGVGFAIGYKMGDKTIVIPLSEGVKT